MREVDTAKPCESVAVIAERMHQRAVGTLVVVNDSVQVVGIVTDRDLVSGVLAKSRRPTETFVHEIMTIAPKTITESSQIDSALLIMRSGRFRRIPVIDRDHKLVGIITLDDILIHLAEEVSQIGQLLQRDSVRLLRSRTLQASRDCKMTHGYRSETNWFCTYHAIQQEVSLRLVDGAMVP